MEQTQIEKLFSEARKKDERIKELENGIIEIKKGFDALNGICEKLISAIEKKKLTFDKDTGELIEIIS